MSKKRLYGIIGGLIVLAGVGYLVWSLGGGYTLIHGHIYQQDDTYQHFSDGATIEGLVLPGDDMLTIDLHEGDQFALTGRYADLVKSNLIVHANFDTDMQALENIPWTLISCVDDFFGREFCDIVSGGYLRSDAISGDVSYNSGGNYDCVMINPGRVGGRLHNECSIQLFGDFQLRDEYVSSTSRLLVDGRDKNMRWMLLLNQYPGEEKRPKSASLNLETMTRSGPQTGYRGESLSKWDVKLYRWFNKLNFL